MADLHELTATEQVAAIATKEVSSVELVNHYLDRIERLDGELNAFVCILGDEARAAAAAADDAVVRGEELGLLHGLPLALKDLHMAAGMPVTFGSKAFADLVAPVDAPVIAALRKEGAVFVGKTNVPEFGPTCYTDNDLFGPTVSPYGSGRTSSGSSGGSASAVAAGLIGLAHGSDGLGSIRTPAAACGLVGLKSTRGRTAGSGIGWLALPVEGPLARTVADCALFLDAMGGSTASDLWKTPPAAPDAFQVAARGGTRKGLRIGRLSSTGIEVELHPECVTALDVTTSLLEEQGHSVAEIPTEQIPPSEQIRQAAGVVLATMGATIMQTVPEDRRPLLMPYTKWLAAQEFSALDLSHAHTLLTVAAIQIQAMLASYDVVIAPTTTAPPPTIAELRADDGEESLAAQSRWSAFTPAANIGGTPAMNLPVHTTRDGLPIGVQLCGSVGDDELLISLAADLEAQVGWQHRHPACWSA